MILVLSQIFTFVFIRGILKRYGKKYYFDLSLDKSKDKIVIKYLCLIDKYMSILFFVGLFFRYHALISESDVTCLFCAIQNIIFLIKLTNRNCIKSDYNIT